MELLSPAGSFEKMKTAFLYGADAVYLSGKEFGLRAQSGNFNEEELAESVEYAHQIDKKVYVTINIYARNNDLQKIEDHVRFLKKIEMDAIILSDPGIFRMVKKILPQAEIHLSTQTNTTNYESVRFWQDLGVKRFILARELSIEEISSISEKTQAELEVFVHGAMCMAYSGRCLLSDYMADRSANTGNCAQPCRWNYRLVEEKRPGEYFPIEEDSRGTYIFNSKDLNLIQYLPELFFAGVKSIKIEGRNKGLYYVAGVTRAYRKALTILNELLPDRPIDHWSDYIRQELTAKYREKITVARSELETISHRHYTSGFIGIEEDAIRQNYSDASYVRKADFLGRILKLDSETGRALIENRGKYVIGDKLQIMDPLIEKDLSIKIESIENENNEPVDFTRPNTKSWIRLVAGMEVGQFVRRLISR